MKECPADLWGTKVPWYWQAFSNDSISTLGEGNVTAVVSPAPSSIAAQNPKSGATSLTARVSLTIAAAMVGMVV
jgi:hypothetical protein